MKFIIPSNKEGEFLSLLSKYLEPLGAGFQQIIIDEDSLSGTVTFSIDDTYVGGLSEQERLRLHSFEKTQRHSF